MIVSDAVRGFLDFILLFSPLIRQQLLQVILILVFLPNSHGFDLYLKVTLVDAIPLFHMADIMIYPWSSAASRLAPLRCYLLSGYFLPRKHVSLLGRLVKWGD